MMIYKIGVVVLIDRKKVVLSVRSNIFVIVSLWVLIWLKMWLVMGFIIFIMIVLGNKINLEFIVEWLRIVWIYIGKIILMFIIVM